MSNLNVVSVTDKDEWEEFVLSRDEANFLSSWNWGVFHKKLNKKVFSLGIKKEGNLVGVVLIVKEEAKRGNYLTVAGGPLIDWSDNRQVKLFVSTIKKLAREEKCLFVRVRPQILNNEKNKAMFSVAGFVQAPMHLTADLTREIDLSKNEEELLAGMRKNTRYEIRKIEKEEIKVKASDDPSDIREFYDHQLELAQKHGFVPFGYEFLHEQFKAFSKDDQALLFHSYKGDDLLASAFVIFYGREAVYHYGISTNKNQRLPGSYACQWSAIKMAKDMGMDRYNLWGVAPEGNKSHRFYGVSVFKRGFGGRDVAYLPAYDMPTSRLYKPVSMFEKIRARIRNLD